MQFQRYCKQGHDKTLSNGSYIVRNGKYFVSRCASCVRARMAREWAAKKLAKPARLQEKP